MTKHLLDLHHVDELKNFAANNLFKLVFQRRVLESVQLVSHVLGSRALKGKIVATEQVQLVSHVIG